MKSLTELFRIGQGPSSSHTMGPRKAAEIYLQRHSQENGRFRVTLYSSLAATGKGHLTDFAIAQVLGEEKTDFVWKPETVLPYHPNGMKFEFCPGATEPVTDEVEGKDAWIVYSKGNATWEQAREICLSRFQNQGYKLPDVARRYAYENFWKRLPKPYTLYHDINLFLSNYIEDLCQNQILFFDIGTIINKKSIAASHIYQMMLDANVHNVRFLMTANADVAEFIPSEGSKVTQKPVKDLGLPKGMTIGGLVRDGQGLLVSGNTLIHPGDSVMVFCHSVNMKKIEKFFL